MNNHTPRPGAPSHTQRPGAHSSSQRSGAYSSSQRPGAYSSSLRPGAYSSSQRPGAHSHTQARRIPILPIAIVAVVIAVLIGISAFSCSQQQTRQDWDWNNLQYINGRMAYVENGQTVSSTGVDVSSLQGDIDWTQVKNDGIDFAMLRCGRRGTTEGELYTDSEFYDNVTGCTSAGLPFGVYFFSQATTEDEAREEAQYVLNLINGTGVTYPVVYDQEYVSNSDARANGLSAEQLTANAQAFTDTVYAAGYETMIYGNQHDLSRLNIDDYKGNIWYAEYTTSNPTSQYHDFAMWQYTNHEEVAGINTSVDMDILFRNDWINRER